MTGRVVLAMSGGVDSSVAAHLLLEQGYEVIGLFMRSGAAEETACQTDMGLLPVINPSSNKQGCCSATDAADARRVADAMDIPFHALNFRDAFGRIKDYFVDEYLSGRTPNPCVMCNNWLKFGKLWEFAQQVQADYIASGHYARIGIAADGSRQLLKGIDDDKDQSYVLFGLPRSLLPNVLFPVGGFTKPEIREIASRCVTRVASKPDSQEICFVPDQDYAGFIRRYHGEVDTSGELVDTAGNVLGQHSGFEKFTIGQRRGLGVAFGDPRFVVEIDASSRRVTVGTRQELSRSMLIADRANWLVTPPDTPRRVTAKIRYQHTPTPATVTMLDHAVGGDSAHANSASKLFRVDFDEPQFGVAPGQAVVLYDGEQVLGGGWIQSTGNGSD